MPTSVFGPAPTRPSRGSMAFLTVERLQSLLPEARQIEVERHVFPQIRALNFVLHEYLGEGVSSSPKLDPQAKALGEYLRARRVDVPESLVAS